MNRIDPNTDTPHTQREHTLSPEGPQCKKTNVYFGGFKLTFNECGNGHSRV